jgi:hypothetical protein
VNDPSVGGATGTGGAAGTSGTGGTTGSGGFGAGGQSGAGTPGTGGATGAGGTSAGGKSGTAGSGTGGSATGGSATGGSATGGSGAGGRGGASGTGAGGRGGTGGAGAGGGATGGTSAGGRGGGGAGGTSAGGAGGTSAGGRGGGAGGGSGTVGSACRAGVGGAGVHAFMCGPAVTSGLAQSIDVFAVGADGKVRWRQYEAGWSSWQLLPGSETITSDVDVTEVGLSTYEVYGLGASGNVVHSHWGNGNWQTVWEDFSYGQPKLMPALYGVAATLTGLNQSSSVIAWVFATGSDGAQWSRSENIATVFGPWATEQGTLSSAPDAVSRAAATWVVARGASPTDVLINKNATNLDAFGQWSGFTKLPGLAGGTAFAYGPCITAWSDTRLDVFAPGGSATSLWHNTSTDGGASWASTWDDWGGGPSIVASPDCVSWGNGRIDIVVVGADGHVWRRGYEGSLVAWEDLGVY